jgi:hypothetical protein
LRHITRQSTGQITAWLLLLRRYFSQVLFAHYCGVMYIIGVRVKFYIDAFFGSLIYLMWTSFALVLSFLVIYFFDDSPKEQMLLLPEWSLLAFFIIKAALDKQEKICPKQVNPLIKLEMAKNMFNLFSGVCVLLFTFSMLFVREYIPMTDVQSSVIQFSNVLLFCGACALYTSAAIQEVKYLNIHNKQINKDT